MLHRLRFLRPKVFNNCLHRPLYPIQAQRYSSRLSPETESSGRNAESSLSDALTTLNNLPEYRLKDINVVKKVIKQAAADVDTPHVVYEGVLNFFIRTSRTTQALFVMKRMEELGFTLLNQTLAKLLVLVSATAENPPPDSANLILEIVAEPEYTEDNLRDLLQTISSYAIDKEKSAQTLFVEAFRVSRGPEYQPPMRMLSTFVAAAVRADKVDDAFAMLAFFVTNRDRAARVQIFNAWLAFLKALRETRSWDVVSYSKALDNMSAHQVSVNIKLFDQVIAQEVKLEDYQTAFQVYGTLKALSRLDEERRARTWERPIRISSHTFATLFKTYNDMDRSRTMKPGILPPRALYKDFSSVFDPSDSKNLVYHSTQFMHVVLRGFIHQVDYAGALVVLRTFAKNGGQLTHLTYYIIVKALIERIWYECRIGRPTGGGGDAAAEEGEQKKTAKKKAKTTWASRFLGVSTKPLLSMKLVNHMLFLISRKTFDVEARMYPFSGEKFRDQAVLGSAEEEERLCKVPTMLMMEHVQRPQPLDFKYEVVPLERLLLRAIWAVDGVGSEEMVHKIMEQTQKEMLPPPRIK